jgi:hypothetical protein
VRSGAAEPAPARGETNIAGIRSPPRASAAPPPDLTEEEFALLDRYSAEGLSRAAAEAQNAYTTARPAEAAEADRRYLLLLNLIAKLDAPPAAPPPEVAARQRAYLDALPAEEAHLAGFPAEERAAKLEEFKATFFADVDPSRSKRPGGDPHGTQ